MQFLASRVMRIQASVPVLRDSQAEILVREREREKDMDGWMDGLTKT